MDDLSLECIGTSKHILKQLVGATDGITDSLQDNGAEISKGKSVCIASSPKLAGQLQSSFKFRGISTARQVRSLGVGLAAGRRNVKVLAKRLRAFRARVGRFRKLRRAGIKTHRILRTGGIAGMTYGVSITGVAPTMLRIQRRMVASAAAPATGPAGQNIDLALMVADGGKLGSVDPAFEAHCGPIGHWATAVWEQWLPRTALMVLHTGARISICKSKNVWSACNGPASVVLATAARIGWTFQSAFSLVTDEGIVLDLTLDPPCVVTRACKQAVHRWRCNNLRSQCGRGEGHLEVQHIWQLLNSREGGVSWNESCRSSLASAVAGRQWPQQRLYKAGLATHGKCMACIREKMSSQGMSAEDAMASAPLGTTYHRLWQCPSMENVRQLHAPAIMLEEAMAGEGNGSLAFEKAVFHVPNVECLVPPAEGAFEWHICPADGLIPSHSTIYTDGSTLEGEHSDLSRHG